MSEEWKEDTDTLRYAAGVVTTAASNQQLHHPAVTPLGSRGHFSFPEMQNPCCKDQVPFLNATSLVFTSLQKEKKSETVA